MSENRTERIDQLLRSIGEEANAAVPFDCLRDGVLLAQKRAEKKRLARRRALTAAASFAILLGAGALFGFGAEMELANDTAAPLTMEAAIADNAPAEAEGDAGYAAPAERYSNSASLAGTSGGAGAFPEDERVESVEPSDCSPSEEPQPGGALLYESSGVFSVSADEVIPAFAQEARYILICEIAAADGETCTAAVVEPLRGAAGGDEIVFSAPEGSYTPGKTYLLLLSEADGSLSSVNDELIIEIDGDSAVISGSYAETLSTEKLRSLLELD